ncbi:hypothetical protein [Chryseobacterium koreense]|uniref:Uncharacterized protein n=1 Tax=Chryseobacterium koreense CCUG 49689 TaxID=1304281 RepID=A0A0J7J2Z9_9FLAO|nr:hypothetical protein [Chryseobacterium koreense]KMQ72416.1 hypothetical protein ACM44_01350 [Chryseobacterium koreense CCUG 49689]MBB5333496.1 hypothetical protein [Chryseobacterium koreense]
MTRANLTSKIQLFVLALIANLATLIVKAQEKAPDLKVDVDVNKGGNAMSGDWMSNPLVWVIGALVVILLIALVARGGSK